MGEILFRGKNIFIDEWVEGGAVFDISGSARIYRPEKHNGQDFLGVIEVDPETICQYKNIVDKNKKKIFDNDICIYSNSEGDYGVGVIKDDYVKWISENLLSEKYIMTPLCYLKCGEEWEVIGNIFDNPDLLTTSSVDSD